MTAAAENLDPGPSKGNLSEKEGSNSKRLTILNAVGPEQRMRRLLSCLWFVLLSSCSLLPFLGEREDFIVVRDLQLVHKGHPYYFAGANMWYGAYLGSPGATGDRERLRRELDALADLGVTNLRILAASELSSSLRSVRPSFQRSPGVLDDSLLIGLDFVLAEMAKRDMHAVLFLGNYWEWSGGFTQYNIWTGGPLIDPEITGHTWDEYMDYSAMFYSNSAAQELFRAYIMRLVTRKNTFNERKYSDDPTIMAWQLANEPRPGTVGEKGLVTLPQFYRWIDETAAFIDSLDPHHLISTGSEGTIGTLVSPDYYSTAHQSRHIDYLTFHVWPHVWGWYDWTRDGETLDSARNRSREYIGEHLLIARELGKPVVMDEFGFVRDSLRVLPGTPSLSRDEYYWFLYQVVEDSILAGAPIAGSNFWAWSGEARAGASTRWQTGDPLMGDPPHEPQGLNSIFLSDTSTLSIIRKHAARMRELGAGDLRTISVQ